MAYNRIIAFVMAGGGGSQLHPLTAARSEPAVPFGARYRVVDFVLSNLVNSQIRTIYLLVQYKSQSLIEHVRKAWTISPLLPNQFVSVVPPQMRVSHSWFLGTADAVNQNINLIEEQSPALVVVFGADHIYRMDLRQMIQFHHQRQADVTIAALRVPLSEAHRFGVVDADSDGQIRRFQEKPIQPTALPNDPTHAYASMGNYVFDTRVLLAALRECRDAGETDFGRHLLPRLLASSKRLFAYDFSSNEVPGLKPYEERGYWRDVGSLDAYFAASQDVLGAEPTFDAFNPEWPIYSAHYQGPVARVLGGALHNSLLGAATVIHDKTLIRNSIIRQEVVIEEDVELEDCIIMDNVRICRGARLRKTIVDQNNLIAPGTCIGHDPQADRLKYLVSPGGVTVVPAGPIGQLIGAGRNKGRGYGT